MKLTDSRKKLQGLLENVIGSKKVYYNPPNGFTPKNYPCIIFHVGDVPSVYADNTRYVNHVVYEILLLDVDAEDELAEKLMDELISAQFIREYTSNNIKYRIYNYFI